MARAAGEAYGLYYAEKGVWPKDLPVGLEYGRDHAPKESYLFTVTHDASSMEYLADMEVSPEVEKELSGDMASWKYGVGKLEALIERGRTHAPVLVKSQVPHDAHAFAQEFYGGVVIMLQEVQEKGK
jgi:hypothetical protein